MNRPTPADHSHPKSRETGDVVSVIIRDSPRHADRRFRHPFHPATTTSTTTPGALRSTGDGSLLPEISSTSSSIKDNTNTHNKNINITNKNTNNIGNQGDTVPHSDQPQNMNTSKHTGKNSTSHATLLSPPPLPPSSLLSSYQYPAPALGIGRTTPWSKRATLFSGITCALILVIHRLLTISSTTTTELFYLYYQPFAPAIFILWLWGINIRYFERRHIRYDVCFPPEEFKYLLPSATLFEIAGIISTLVLSSATMFLFYCMQGNFEAASIQPPLIYLGLLGGLLLLPSTTLFYGETRRFFATTAWRVITPIRSVTWADFLLADILTSLAKAISDTERAVCAMASGDIMHPAMESCSDASWVIPAGLALPYIWRLIQCVRVYKDTDTKAQVYNAIKYSTALPVIALSALKYHVTTEAWKSFWKPLWLFTALINSAYSYYWDVEMDWDIRFFSLMRQQKSIFPRPVFQQHTQYKRSFYYYLLFSNAILRLSWIYKVSPHLRRNHVAVFFIVLAEAFRRFQWVFVRIEVELRKIQLKRPELGQLVPAVALGEHAGDAAINDDDNAMIVTAANHTGHHQKSGRNSTDGTQLVSLDIDASPGKRRDDQFRIP